MQDNSVIIQKLLPEELPLLAETTVSHKGIYIPEKNNDKYIFKINLLKMMEK